MKHRNLALILFVAVLLGWWIMRDNPEADVRRAHAELAGILGKTREEGDGTALLETRALQALVAEACEISGDAGRLTGIYSPEELASTALRTQALFHSIELTFGELSISFPDEDRAVVHFSAVLQAAGKTENPGTLDETRAVVSRMQRIDGRWRFAGFDLTDPDAEG